MRNGLRWSGWVGCLLLIACVGNDKSGATAPPVAALAPGAGGAPLPGRVDVVTVASGLVRPWSLAFLPGGRMLVTEKAGSLRVVTPEGRVGAPLAGVPAVAAEGQGGLLDVVVGPGFAQDRTIFLAYAEPVAGGNARTAVARAKLQDEGLTDLRVIFRQEPASAAGFHYGARIVFAEDGNLWVTLGERFERDRAQGLDNHLGKVVRIAPDGSVPADNPFRSTAGARPELFSYGHRNAQGAARHPATGRLWLHEHGPQGGDEVNIAAPGRNHGWPVITYGREYGSGTAIGEGTRRADVVEPLHVWVPSIAPSGMAFYTGDAVPGWKGSLFVGALTARLLVRLALDGDRVVGEERLLTGLKQRVRDVRMGPDGRLYLLTDERNGRILRVVVR